MITDTIENMVLSNTYADLIVPVQSDTEDFLKNYSQYGAQLLGQAFRRGEGQAGHPQGMAYVPGAKGLISRGDKQVIFRLLPVA